MNETISNLTTAAESSPYPITFTLHEKIRVDDDEDDRSNLTDDVVCTLVMFMLFHLILA